MLDQRTTPTDDEMVHELGQAVRWLSLLNEVEEEDGLEFPYRCRERSLAITKIEEAIHWLAAMPEGKRHQ